MTAVPQPTDPGATPVAARAVAPDLARGGMLLLIAVANVHFYVYGHSLGIRGYPRDIAGVDRIVVLLQMTLVDGRAYPLFGLLFGYGIVQLAKRRESVGLPQAAVTRLVRRRGYWMIVIGLVHGVLLWSGDIVGAYGLLAVLLAGLLVGGSDRALLVTGCVGAALISLLYAPSGLALAGDPRAFLPSVAVAEPATAAFARLVEWPSVGLLGQAFSVFAAVALGAWTARRRLLDEPDRHRPWLVRMAVVGLAAAVLCGLPLALIAAQLWISPPLAAVLLAGTLHALGGYAGGLGYAAVFGLVAIGLTRSGRPGPVAWALAACGQRSLSCYLAQSVVFAALLPAWTLGIGAEAKLWQTALLAVATWLMILAAAAWLAWAGYRGPAEVLLRRLTYGPHRAA